MQVDHVTTQTSTSHFASTSTSVSASDYFLKGISSFFFSFDFRLFDMVDVSDEKITEGVLGVYQFIYR